MNFPTITEIINSFKIFYEHGDKPDVKLAKKIIDDIITSLQSGNLDPTYIYRMQIYRKNDSTLLAGTGDNLSTVRIRCVGRDEIPKKSDNHRTITEILSKTHYDYHPYRGDSHIVRFMHSLEKVGKLKLVCSLHPDPRAMDFVLYCTNVQETEFYAISIHA